MASRVTLEKVLTHPAAFGLHGATAVQRAICRIADGLALDELEEDVHVVQAVGGPEAVQALSRMVGTMPAEIYIVAGIRGGKSILSAALAVRSAVTCNLDGIGPKEPPVRVSVVSLTRDLGQVVYGYILGAMMNGAALRPLLVGDPLKSSMMVRHPTGRLVEIRVVAGSRAGASVAARYSAGVIVDEAPKMQGASDGTINFDHLRSNVLGRMRPGSQLIAVGSPWAPRGPIYEATMKFHGKPCAHLVVVRAPGPVMNPAWWTPERIEQVRTAPDGQTSYVTDVLGEFRDSESGWLAASEVDSVTRAGPIAIPKALGAQYFAAMDPATRRNAWTLAIVARTHDVLEGTERIKLVFVRCRQWVPSPGSPLKPAEVLAQVKDELEAYGLVEVSTDQWSHDMLAALAEQIGLSVVEERAPAEEIDKRYHEFRARVLQGDVELPPDREVKADLTAVKMRTTMRGMKPDLPVTNDGRHCDYVPAIVLAAHLAGGEPAWIRAGQAVADRSDAAAAEEESQRGSKGPIFCAPCKLFYQGPCPTHL